MSAGAAVRRLRLAGALAAALLACAPPAVAGAQRRPGSPTARLVDRALARLGGRRAVAGMRSFRLRATGRTWIFDEGPRPTDDVTPASTFSTTVTYDRARSGEERLRADSVRTSLGAARRVTEVSAGRLGAISGVDANGNAANRAMTSDRWAAGRRVRFPRTSRCGSRARRCTPRPGPACR
jgi:hypothetical protein